MSPRIFMALKSDSVTLICDRLKVNDVTKQYFLSDIKKSQVRVVSLSQVNIGTDTNLGTGLVYSIKTSEMEETRAVSQVGNKPTVHHFNVDTKLKVSSNTYTNLTVMEET